jgi:hypothetical protein
MTSEKWSQMVRSSKSYFATGGLQPISSSWRQAPWNSRPVIFFQLDTCGHSPYVTSSLMRGWVCSLQLLLPLSSGVIHWSESGGTHDHVLLCQIWDSSKVPGQVTVFITSRKRMVLWFRFLRLLRLAGRYANSPAHRIGSSKQRLWMLICDFMSQSAYARP